MKTKRIGWSHRPGTGMAGDNGNFVFYDEGEVSGEPVFGVQAANRKVSALKTEYRLVADNQAIADMLDDVKAG